MPDAVYTLVWTKIATKDLQQLQTNDAQAVLNNVTTLLRDPFPPFSATGGDGMYLLHVGLVTVAYELIGFTIRVLAMDKRPG